MSAPIFIYLSSCGAFEAFLSIVPAKKPEKHASFFTSGTIGAATISSALVVPFSFLVFHAGDFRAESIAALVGYFWLTIVVAGLLAVCNASARSTTYAVALAIKNLIPLLALAYAHKVSLESLLLIEIVAAAAVVCVLLVSRLEINRRQFSWQKFRELSLIGLPYLLVTAGLNLSGNADRWAINYALDAASSADYFFIGQITSIAATIAAAIQVYLYPRVLRHVQQNFDLNALRKRLLKYNLILLCLCALVYAVGGLLIRFSLENIFAKYSNGDVLIIPFVLAATFFTATNFEPYFRASSNGKVYLSLQGFLIAVALLANLALAYLDATIEQFAWIFASLKVFAFCLNLFVTTQLSERKET
jgi:O-antigen/teichoic acid export membrane protein